ncbi:Transmembrane protein [Trema orientale]|uniref:Transmembrane protein n=1 Tax=Trema orientale TaxID=63057 RepID=A0A2P5BFI2_TREOI|nr:Transmembrane protein [Trema orientale]
MAHKELDLDDGWELIPDDGFLGYRDDGEKKILYRKWSGSDSDGLMNDYFKHPLANNSRKVREKPGNRAPQRVPSQLVPVPIPIHLNPTTTRTRGENPDAEDEVVPPPTPPPPPIEVDQDSVSKVFFKKMKENEFVDMKMDSTSPKSPTTRGGFMPPQIDAAVFNFDDKVEAMPMVDNMSSPRMVNMKNISTSELEADSSDDGLNIWKLGLTGIGAICSFGLAAATICILFLGSHHRNKNRLQNQKIRFQIYNDDKRIKQVVHQATKLNEAMSAVRGLPLTRAHVTYGGYYEGL